MDADFGHTHGLNLSMEQVNVSIGVASVLGFPYTRRRKRPPDPVHASMAPRPTTRGYASMSFWEALFLASAYCDGDGYAMNLARHWATSPAEANFRQAAVY